jgi:hypothetical protein
MAKTYDEKIQELAALFKGITVHVTPIDEPESDPDWRDEIEEECLRDDRVASFCVPLSKTNTFYVEQGIWFELGGHHRVEYAALVDEIAKHLETCPGSLFLVRQVDSQFSEWGRASFETHHVSVEFGRVIEIDSNDKKYN